MKCIICKNTKNDNEFSDEHVFPDAVGGTLIIKPVCKTCNDLLGHSVDSHLVNHFLIQGRRATLGLKGKKGKIPNPIEEGFLADDPDQKVRLNLHRDTKKIHLLPRVQKICDENCDISAYSVSVDKSDYKKLQSIVNKKLKIHGKQEISMDEIEKSVKIERTPSPRISASIKIDTFQYQRALLKIAYELAWYWLGDNYLEDKTGEMIRQAFMDNNLKGSFHPKYLINCKSGLYNEIPTQKLWESEPNSHIAFLWGSNNQIFIYLRVFEIFAATVVVSVESQQYSWDGGRFLANNAVLKEYRESSLVEEIDRLDSSD